MGVRAAQPVKTNKTMSLDAAKAYVERIESAMRKTLADCEIEPSHATVTVQPVENTAVFEIRVAFTQGSVFVWAGRVRQEFFDHDLEKNMAALRVWL